MLRAVSGGGIRVLAMGGVLAVLCAEALGSVPAPPKPLYEEIQMPSDTTSLLTYLDKGLPYLLSAPQGGTVPADAALRRWPAYYSMVRELGERKSANAAPVLLRLIEKPLPDPLVDDLILTIPRLDDGLYDWSAWDREVAMAVLQFRAACVAALAKCSPEEAKPLVARLLDETALFVEAEFRKEQPDGRVAQGFGDLCVTATRLGLKDGIDHMIELLEIGDSWLATPLMACAGPQVPVNADPSPEARAQWAAQWREWWQAHRESFVPPADVAVRDFYNQLKRTPEEDFTYPPPKRAGRVETVRSYLLASEAQEWGSDWVRSLHPEAREWLEANYERHARSLGKVLEEAEVGSPLWRAAVPWYTRTKSKGALDWLRAQLLEPGNAAKLAENPADPDLVLRNLKEHFPEEFPEIARQAVEQMGPVAEHAARALLYDDSSGENTRYVLERYAQLAERFPGLRSTAVQALRGKDIPGVREVFVDALFNGPAGFAVAALRQGGHVEGLSETEKKKYDQLVADPAFELTVLEGGRSEQRQKAARVAETVQGTDARSACVLGGALRIMTELPAEAGDPDSTRCVEKLRNCVAAYRLSRSRGEK